MSKLVLASAVVFSTLLAGSIDGAASHAFAQNEDFQTCLRQSAGPLMPRGGANNVTNSCSVCVQFDPIVQHDSGKFEFVSQMTVLGHPIQSSSLNSGERATFFFGMSFGSGSYTVLYQNPRPCT